MAQQTAIDWIVDQMLSEGHKQMWKDMIQQAKQMEKEQTLDFGKRVADNWGMTDVPEESIEKYYHKVNSSADETEYLLSTEANAKRLEESVQQLNTEPEENKRSAVVFLIAELIQKKLMALRYDKDTVLDEIISKARHMEILQMADAFNSGFTNGQIGEISAEILNGIQYYREKYQTK